MCPVVSGLGKGRREKDYSYGVCARCVEGGMQWANLNQNEALPGQWCGLKTWGSTGNPNAYNTNLWMPQKLRKRPLHSWLGHTAAGWIVCTQAKVTVGYMWLSLHKTDSNLFSVLLVV